jgi:hypothetical protein
MKPLVEVLHGPYIDWQVHSQLCRTYISRHACDEQWCHMCTLPNCMATARAARAGVGRTALGAGSAADASATASAASVHTCGKHSIHQEDNRVTMHLTCSLCAHDHVGSCSYPACASTCSRDSRSRSR